MKYLFIVLPYVICTKVMSDRLSQRNTPLRSKTSPRREYSGSTIASFPGPRKLSVTVLPGSLSSKRKE